jgi:large subunit ribosomal protein L21
VGESEGILYNRLPMSTSSGPLTAVIVSGGKQYRVAPGDRVLVDRLHAEPGSELTFDRVLLVADGESTKVGLHELQGQSVLGRVLGHRRGPKIDVLRYKSKKRVRVHRGARADLTAVEIVSIGAAAPKRKRSARAAAEPEPEGGED